MEDATSPSREETMQVEQDIVTRKRTRSADGVDLSPPTALSKQPRMGSVEGEAPTDSADSVSNQQASPSESFGSYLFDKIFMLNCNEP